MGKVAVWSTKQKILARNKLSLGPFAKIVQSSGKCGKRRHVSVVEVKLGMRSATVFPPQGKIKCVQYAELRSLFKRWEKMFQDKKMGRELKCESKEVPRANIPLLSQLALECSLDEPNKEAILKRYLKRFFFEQPWNQEVLIAVGHAQIELVALPEGTLQPEIKLQWKNTGEDGVFLVLGDIKQVEKNCKYTFSSLSDGLGVATFCGGCPSWLSFHGGDVDGVRFFGWRCSVVDFFLYVPKSIDIRDVLIAGGVVYTHAFATLTKRLVDNAVKQLLWFCRNAVPGATRLEREYIGITEKKVEKRRRKRRLNLNVDNPPPCLSAVLYPRGSKAYPKDNQRWRVAAVVRNVAGASGVPVRDIVDLPRVEQAWAGAKAESSGAFLKSLQSTSSRAYPVSCASMAKCQLCPYGGNMSECAALRGQSTPRRATPDGMWLNISYEK